MIPIASQWLRQVQLTKAPKTYLNYSVVLQEFDELTPESLLDHIAAWRAKGLSQNTIVLKLTTVRQLLSFMQSRGVNVNEMLEITHSVHSENKIQQYVTTSQAKALISHANGIQKKLIIAICYYCALRIGECLSLQVSDINDDAIVARNTKTHMDRQVPLLTKEVRQLLQEYLTRYRPTTDLFPGVKRNSFEVYFKRLCKSLGYPLLHPHSLRAGFCTQAFQSNVDPITIMAITGHQNITNLQKYSHCTPVMLARASKIFTDN